MALPIAPSFLIRLFGFSLARKLAGTRRKLDKDDPDTGSSFTKFEKELYARRLATLLVEEIREAVLTNLFNNPGKSPFTLAMQNSTSTTPLVRSGEFLTHLKVRRSGFPAYTVGWDRVPLGESHGRHTKGSRKGRHTLTALDLIRMNEEGFMIDLNSEKGRAMIRWMGWAYKQKTGKRMPSGKSGRTYLYMPPRKFYRRAINRFISRWNGVGGAIIIRTGDTVHIKVR